MSVSQRFNYICFYYWNTTESAVNPYQKEYLPVEGLLYCEYNSQTQINIYYTSGIYVQITHTKESTRRVIRGFKNAVNNARMGTQSVEVNYNPPIPPPYSPPPPTLPPLFVTGISIKKVP